MEKSTILKTRFTVPQTFLLSLIILGFFMIINLILPANQFMSEYGNLFVKVVVLLTGIGIVFAK